MSPHVDPALSRKLRFWSFSAMVLLVYVHAYNLHSRYLEPWTRVDEGFSAANALQYFIANGLVRFRIPILFAISGYLFAMRDVPGSWGPRIRRRLTTLGLPYVLWSALALILTFAFEHWTVTRGWVKAAELSPFGPGLPFIEDYDGGQLLVRWLLVPAAFQLWFLRSLLLLNLAYPLLKRAVTSWPRTFFAVTTAIWVVSNHIPLFDAGILFFPLGMWLALQQHDPMQRPRWLRLDVAVAVWVGAAALRTWLVFAYPQHSFGVDTLLLALYRATEIGGILAAWYGCDPLVESLMHRRWFAWLSGFSFIVYALHVPLVNYLTEGALQQWGHGAGTSLAIYLLAPVVIVAIAVTLGAVLRRVVPAWYGVLTGGRGFAS